VATVSAPLVAAAPVAKAPPRNGRSGDAMTVAPAAAVASRTFLPPTATPIAAARPVSSSGLAAPAALGAAVMAASAAPGVPACTSTNVSANYGTPSISHGKITLVYWGSWSTHPYDSYWQTMANTPAFYNRLHEYGVSTGSYVQRLDYAAGTVNVALTEEQLKTGIKAAYGSYTPTSSDIFVVLLPSGTSSLGDNQYGYGGHHSSLTAGSTTVPWAVIEYSSNALTTEWRTSHEIFEALTDFNATGSCSNGTCSLSTGSGWIPELGDGCNGQLGTIAGLQTQKFWSNAACRCVNEEDLNNVDTLANGRFDYTIFRPSQGAWYGFNFSPNWGFGLNGDQSFAGDYNGDGRAEFALLRTSGTPTAFILDTIQGIYVPYTFGAAGDTAVVGDFDNPPDGRSDLAVWQPSLGWRFRSSVTGATSAAVSWGLAGDFPIPADYDGDGITDFAVVRPSNGTWYILPSSRPGTWYGVVWGFTYGDIPVTGDFNGDGLADWAFWRPSTGVWYVNYQGTSTAYWQQWGLQGDIPVPRDVDGDWLTDLQVWRPSNGTWYTINSSTWTTSSQQWGLSGDNPIGH
jgi:hypothetical protein